MSLTNDERRAPRDEARAKTFEKTLDDLADIGRQLSAIGPPLFVITSDGTTTETWPADYKAQLAEYERENARLRPAREAARRIVAESAVGLAVVASRHGVDWQSVLRFTTSWDDAHQTDAGVQAKMLAAMTTDMPASAADVKEANWLEPGEAIAMLRLPAGADGYKTFDRLIGRLPQESVQHKGRKRLVEVTAWRNLCSALKAASFRADDWSDAINVEAAKASIRQQNETRKRGE
jgi:hypothetical protein